ncbi:hypothetical protein [Mycobacterium sp. AZCC_0083]|uniref:hypothetical protein n=1 Tax=Mycobacterium sp. AZCC_0083 TaxID=2735882 RepID=UPI001611DC18|nr:hypothetical protein [Mycobacterium sp. AZCC_0083]MBB5164595.1 hypothetical protein [Mycobacterium sp. AZCC_0083]
MIGIIRSCLTSGVAVLGASTLVVAPVAPPPTRPEPPPVALAALTQPLAAPTTVASIQPFDLVGQQVGFHVGFVTDFVVTGAQLVARQIPIPGTLLQDIQNGTPLPVAVGRALQTFADVEIDAGRELVGFATEYVNFQLDFLSKVIRDVMATVSSTTIAFAAFAAGVVGQLVTSVAAGLTAASTQAEPASAEPVSVGAAPASTRQTTSQAATERRSDDGVVDTAKGSTKVASTAENPMTEQPKKPAISVVEAVEAPDTVTDSTVSAQGGVRSATTDRDGVTQANKGGADEARSKPDAAPEDKGDTGNAHQKDSAPQKDKAPQKDSATNQKP